MDGILVGLLPPFLSQTLPLRKTNQTERLCRQTAPGSLPVPGVGGVLRPDAPSPAGPQGCREAGKRSRGGDSA